VAQQAPWPLPPPSKTPRWLPLLIVGIIIVIAATAVTVSALGHTVTHANSAFSVPTEDPAAALPTEDPTDEATDDPSPAFTSAAPKPYEPGYCEANPTAAICNLPTEAPVTQAPASVETEAPASAETVSQANAVSTAQDYLGYTSFSRSGLIAQLVFEQFSTADATYAVDKISPDWNEQAAKTAKDYLGYTSFSRQGLVDQLTFDGFTPAQAEYGVSQSGL
jgi:hypothetical protein